MQALMTLLFRICFAVLVCFALAWPTKLLFNVLDTTYTITFTEAYAALLLIVITKFVWNFEKMV